MNLENLVGQVLDEKYKIERELGRGGMGAVYLSTHVGTERPVAVKVIVPQFMERAEFVERFRREARAAGRLRHPNVVDVTDFGFADTPDGRVAYLVMEYLDGCTLGEILEEEKQLPLSWTLDIIEQVSSAIHTAHLQGIIHRDLKPDNIWLEPNQRGGYTVKVLDFGIAKLEAVPSENLDSQIDVSISPNSPPTRSFSQKTSVQDEDIAKTIAEDRGLTAAGERQTFAEPVYQNTLLDEGGTLLQPSAEIEPEAGTAILSAPTRIQTIKQASEAGTNLIPEQTETGGSRLKKRSTADLTRVGAVLGTPLYMSPEQCRGEKLTAKSDGYSLGVIAYQMLSGKTPFSGDFMEVMQAHRETPPPPLEAKKIKKTVEKVISSALAKNPDERPATAQAFASQLRSHSEGIGVLLQRALVIYSQHLPKFLLLAVLIYAPIIVTTVLQIIVNFLDSSDILSSPAILFSKGAVGLTAFFFSFFCGYLILGTTAWLVTQILATPLRPVLLRPALKVVKSKWKSLAFTGMLSSILSLLGYCLILPGLILSVLWALVAPVVMMENSRGIAALRRSKELTKRSLKTTAAAVFIMFLVPIIVGGLVAFVASVTVKAFSDSPPAAVQKDETARPDARERAGKRKESDITIKTNNSPVVKIDETADGEEKEKDVKSRVRTAVRESLTQIFMLPFTILLTSFSAIVIALLYLKTRQAGGESMQELLAQLTDDEEPEKNWQKRVREKVLQSGRTASRGTSLKSRKRTTEG